MNYKERKGTEKIKIESEFYLFFILFSENKKTILPTYFLLNYYAN